MDFLSESFLEQGNRSQGLRPTKTGSLTGPLPTWRSPLRGLCPLSTHPDMHTPQRAQGNCFSSQQGRARDKRIPDHQAQHGFATQVHRGAQAKTLVYSVPDEPRQCGTHRVNKYQQPLLPLLTTTRVHPISALASSHFQKPPSSFGPGLYILSVTS